MRPLKPYLFVIITILVSCSEESIEPTVDGLLGTWNSKHKLINELFFETQFEFNPESSYVETTKVYDAGRNLLGYHSRRTGTFLLEKDQLIRTAEIIYTAPVSDPQRPFVETLDELVESSGGSGEAGFVELRNNGNKMIYTMICPPNASCVKELLTTTLYKN